jgi:hypothetical protein
MRKEEEVGLRANVIGQLISNKTYTIITKRGSLAAVGK